MIVDFAHKELKQFFEKGNAKGIDPSHARKLKRQLHKLNTAAHVKDMNVPGWRLHPLKGDRKGTWAVDVSGSWRLTFNFREGNASKVNYEQYH